MSGVTMIEPHLQGRVALVTGANQGIGAAIAIALAEQGVDVCLNYLRLGEDDPGVQSTGLPGYASARAHDASEVEHQIRSSGGNAISIEGDLSKPETIPTLFEQTEQRLGPVEILICNADAWVGDTFLPVVKDQFGRGMAPISTESHDASFAVNSRATALLIAEFAGRHIERGANWGRIVGLTTGGSGGFPGEVTYGASKNALESYIVAAAHELGGYGITANTICPPPTDTGWITKEMAQQFSAMPPLFHVAKPDEVAEVALYFVSHQARFITGEKLTMR
jgi:3-oxoacyl-[acyl-carrier protein] reductase